MSMFTQIGGAARPSPSDIPLPGIVVCLRVVGVLCPIAGLILAGANNMSDAAGMAVMLASLILTLLWFALGSVVRLLNRIETHLSRTEAGRTIGALNQS